MVATRSSFTAIATLLLGAISPTTALVDGIDATPYTFEYAVSVQRTSGLGASHFCGGTIIGSKTVLTAGTCCEGNSASSMRVHYGSHDRAAGGADADVDEAIIHPNFNSGTREHNLCILHAAELDLSVANVGSAHVSDIPSSVWALQPLHVAGWGTADAKTNKTPRNLQTIIQKGVDQKRCVSTWADTAPITDSICAEAIPKIGILAGQPKASTCFLDSGSPLVDLLGGTLVGVVSNFNRDCTSEPKPNVYTDVHANADWIHANTV